LKITTKILLASLVLVTVACTKNASLFEELTPESTGIGFSNTVTQTEDNNVLNYPYYFNGGGVAVADFNLDGLQDIYFTGNMVENKLYLNKGNLKFEDITSQAGVAVPIGWKTGVTVEDINLDGFPDLYVCRSAMSDSTLRRNLLFINNGNLTFTEQAQAYGIADDSYSTGAAFLDYDKDGDKDLLVLNHSLPRYAGFNRLLTNLKNQEEPRFQTRLYKNENGKFTESTKASGISGNVLSFGLGLAIADVPNDGWPDVYISNDFNEEDYLFINQQNGTFLNTIRDATGHVSLFSMGSDIADVNNDGLTDILTLDMLPESNERIKLSSGDDNYDKYRILVESGFHHQTMRNMLHLNNGDGTFSEIGQYAGISNSDWSWSALFSDFDGDGGKDLFIGNGYEKDYTNMQFLKYTVDAKIRSNQTGERTTVDQIINAMPPIHVGNILYKNNGDLTFSRANEDWGLSRIFKSNGAAVADLDNDNDPDLIINSMNEPAVILMNTAAQQHQNKFFKVDLLAANKGKNVLHTRVAVHQGTKQQIQEFSPYRGFQSSMLTPMIFGTGGEKIDSVTITWPDLSTTSIKNIQENSIAPSFQSNQPWTVKSKTKTTEKYLFAESTHFPWIHHPADTNDFKRQVLLPRLFSYSGPKTAQGDVNGDGLTDVYFCGPQHQPGTLFLQTAEGNFRESTQTSFESDKEHQDEDAELFDADGDGDLDLIVVSGGYNFNTNDPLLQDRLYINDGKGNFALTTSNLPKAYYSGSAVAVLDVEKDGDSDLFIASRLTPGSWPEPPTHQLLINNGKGVFTPSEANQFTGMICDAIATDLNGDGRQDLVTAGEWNNLSIWINQNGQLQSANNLLPESLTGWWNTLLSGDFDNDGDQDLIAGNYGSNNQFKVSREKPATLVYKDFNQDGQVDPFFCYYIGDISYPYASRDEALTQITQLKPRFPDYNSYAQATLENIFKPEELDGANTLVAEELETIYLENKNGKLIKKQLPKAVQFSPIHAMVAADIDQDNDLDLIMAGNETYARVRIGKSDANHGQVLINDGQGNFTLAPYTSSNLKLMGDTRSLSWIKTATGPILISAETGKQPKIFKPTH